MTFVAILKPHESLIKFLMRMEHQKMQIALVQKIAIISFSAAVFICFFDMRCIPEVQKLQWFLKGKFEKARAGAATWCAAHFSAT